MSNINDLTSTLESLKSSLVAYVILGQMNQEEVSDLILALSFWEHRIKLIEAKFTSGNEIPVERIVLTRKEWYGN